LSVRTSSRANQRTLRGPDFRSRPDTIAMRPSRVGQHLAIALEDHEHGAAGFAVEQLGPREDDLIPVGCGGQHDGVLPVVRTTCHEARPIQHRGQAHAAHGGGHFLVVGAARHRDAADLVGREGFQVVDLERQRRLHGAGHDDLLADQPCRRNRRPVRRRRRSMRDKARRAFGA